MTILNVPTAISELTKHTEMLEWLDRRIASAQIWLEDHGRRAKRSRPEHEIVAKEYDVARFEEIKGMYLKAAAKRGHVP